MTTQLTPHTATQLPPPQDDPLGLHAWAAEHCIHPSQALVLCGSLLSNLAGNSVSFDGSIGLNGQPGLSLALSTSDSLLRRAVASLATRLEPIQNRLIQNAKGFRLTTVDEVFHRTEMGASSMVIPLQLLQPGVKVGTLTAGPEGILERELSNVGRANSYENLVRPRFMINGGTLPDPAKSLGEFHHATCLAAACTEHLPSSDRQRHQRVDVLGRFLDGSEVRVKSRSAVNRLIGTLRGIFIFGSADTAWLLDHRREFIERFILMRTAARSAAQPFDESKSIAFEKRFDRSAYNIIARRRAGTLSEAYFCDEQARAEFMSARRSYIFESADCPLAISTLPDMAAWTLLYLAGGRIPEHLIVHQAMTAARDIRNEMLMTIRSHEQANESLRKLEVGSKIVERIQAKGPMKRRELVRGFDDQRREVHEPIIRTLIGCHVLSEDSNRCLQIGSVPFSRLTPSDFINEPQLLS